MNIIILRLLFLHPHFSRYYLTVIKVVHKVRKVMKVSFKLFTEAVDPNT